LNILTPELISGTAEWIARYKLFSLSWLSFINVLSFNNSIAIVWLCVYSCQTYEGGLGGEPGNEAHGGVTYCGLAALVLLNKTNLIDIHRLLVRILACLKH
jgi:prenyltransferase beta subunit